MLSMMKMMENMMLVIFAEHGLPALMKCAIHDLCSIDRFANGEALGSTRCHKPQALVVMMWLLMFKMLLMMLLIRLLKLMMLKIMMLLT